MLAMSEAEAFRADSSDLHEHWARVAEFYDPLQRPYLRAYALYRSAICLVRRRASNAAVAPLRAARALASRLGCGPMLTEIDALATLAGADLGATSNVTAPSREHVFGLTPREAEVLAVLATGATNRIIARRLFISERTAGVHVSKILAKLAVTNRTEAARMAQRVGLDGAGGRTASDR